MSALKHFCLAELIGFLIFQDSLQGYKSQNKFLNKEILELTELRRNAENREKALEAKVLFLVDSPTSRNRKYPLFQGKSIPKNDAEKHSNNMLLSVSTMSVICFCLCCSPQRWRPSCVRWSVSTWSFFRK